MQNTRAVSCEISIDAEAAKVLGVARHTLSRVLNGQAGLSAEMAIRLEKAGWSNAAHWLHLQTAFDSPAPDGMKM